MPGDGAPDLRLQLLLLALQQVLQHRHVHAVVDLERLQGQRRRRGVVDLPRTLGAAQQIVRLMRDRQGRRYRSARLTIDNGIYISDGITNA